MENLRKAQEQLSLQLPGRIHSVPEFLYDMLTKHENVLANHRNVNICKQNSTMKLAYHLNVRAQELCLVRIRTNASINSFAPNDEAWMLL